MPFVTFHRRRHYALLTAVLVAFGIQNAHAQPAPPKTAAEPPADAPKVPGPNRTPDAPGRPANPSQNAAAVTRQLPPDNTTPQTLELPGRVLKFSATAGSIPLNADDGHITAELAYVAYQLDGANALTRPVTFLFNGGPGSASAWVHIVGFGPWRLALDNASFSPSAPPVLVPNAETWLDFTDLVFIDPAGTGFSRIARSEAAGGGVESNRNQGSTRYFYSVNGDVESVAEMIEKWLRKHGRLASPKILVGESYGGIRAPKIVHRLQTQSGVGISALMLISPVMDFGLFRGPRHHLNTYVNSLPTIAAAAREAKAEPFQSRNELAEVETYARGEYLLDLMRGPRDPAAVDRIVKRVAGYSGLPEPIIRQYGGRLDEYTYIREANRAAGKQASGYDTTITGDDPDSSAYFSHWDDPIAAGLNAPVTAAMIELYSKLGWKTDLRYNLAASDAFRSWQWGNTTNAVESFSQLRSALALDPRLRVLVTHGATDLRTPYLASVLLLEQLPTFADRPQGRVSFSLFPGGHMHYSRAGSRESLHAAAKALAEALSLERKAPE